ncbi:hypothetical protein ACYOEI_04250 [Singulisphaera rosea]
MSRLSRTVLLGFLTLLVVTADIACTNDSDTIEVTDYLIPKNDVFPLDDDRIEDKETTFDPALVDRRTLEGWSLNASEAVIRLDVPAVKPDVYPDRLVLHPSYTAATQNMRGQLLPSVNMIDGKAKQFDDGLMAAIDQAYYLGHGDTMKSRLQTLKRIREKVTKGSPADDYLAAGLSLAGDGAKLTPRARSLAEKFLSRPALSKPIGVYTWNPSLSECFRVLRFFAQSIRDEEIPLEIARVLREDEALRKDYVAAYSLDAKMTNPLVGFTPVDFLNGVPSTATRPAYFSMFPPSSSRETTLFNSLFPNGFRELYSNGRLPQVDLMRELITAIRIGEINLKPRKDGGWYDYQAYALETLLMPEKGEESAKLLLTKSYKKRMLEAFKALLTKRRETHVRNLAEVKSEVAMMPLKEVRPRLRVEPNPTYFLRTARSYAFLANVLESALGEPTLKSLHGLRESGSREPDLQTELRSIRELFYGLYFLSAEDIGLEPSLMEGEAADRNACEKAANDWLANLKADPDLAADTRVAVPIYYNRMTGSVRLWMTIGVRLTALEARYARAPRVRPADGSGEWNPVPPNELATAEYIIPVDEFAEVELKDGKVLSRTELRTLCDQSKTRDKILDALNP